jgi:hypothetical protein
MGLLYAGLSLIGGWFGGYFGAYFNKKGENLATKEDIAEITERTKSIEAKISNEMWVGQRNWDLKRDAALEVMREAASFQESVIGLIAFWRAMHKTPGMMAIPNPEAAANLDRYKRCTGSFWRAKFVASLLLDDTVTAQIEVVEVAGRRVVDLTQLPNAAEEECEKRALAMRDAQLELVRLVRVDLLEA